MLAIPINVGVTANPASPQSAGTTVRITVGSNYNDPGAWSISADGTFLAGQLSNSYRGGPRGNANWVATPGTHQITGTISPTACPYGADQAVPETNQRDDHLRGDGTDAYTFTVARTDACRTTTNTTR